jgi:hypothetical protein
VSEARDAADKVTRVQHTCTDVPPWQFPLLAQGIMHQSTLSPPLGSDTEVSMHSVSTGLQVGEVMFCSRIGKTVIVRKLRAEHVQ